MGLKIKYTKALLLLAIIVVIALLISFFVFPFLLQLKTTRKDINIHSDMSFLNACIEENLKEYYKTNKSYPENLNVLKSSIFKYAYADKIPSGPNVMDYFNEFRYSSDGNSYYINWQAKHGDTQYLHKEEAFKGESPHSELYINGKLLKRENK